MSLAPHLAGGSRSQGDCVPKPRRTIVTQAAEAVHNPRSIPREGGARARLTYEFIDELVGFVRGCLYLEVACRCAGISYKTVMAWIAEGRELVARIENGQFPAGNCTRRQALLVDLYIELTEALALSENEDVQRLEALAKNGDFNAIKFRLERRFPGRWGQRKTLNIEAGNNDIEEKLATESRVGQDALPRIVDYRHEIQHSEEFRQLDEQLQSDIDSAQEVEIIEEDDNE